MKSFDVNFAIMDTFGSYFRKSIYPHLHNIIFVKQSTKLSMRVSRLGVVLSLDY